MTFLTLHRCQVYDSQHVWKRGEAPQLLRELTDLGIQPIVSAGELRVSAGSDVQSPSPGMHSGRSLRVPVLEGDTWNASFTDSLESRDQESGSREAKEGLVWDDACWVTKPCRSECRPVQVSEEQTVTRK